MKRIKVRDYKDRSVFGVPLQVIVQRSGQPLPQSIQQAMRYLRSQCLDQVRDKKNLHICEYAFFSSRAERKMHKHIIAYLVQWYIQSHIEKYIFLREIKMSGQGHNLVKLSLFEQLFSSMVPVVLLHATRPYLSTSHLLFYHHILELYTQCKFARSTITSKGLNVLVPYIY